MKKFINLLSALIVIVLLQKLSFGQATVIPNVGVAGDYIGWDNTAGNPDVQIKHELDQPIRFYTLAGHLTFNNQRMIIDKDVNGGYIGMGLNFSAPKHLLDLYCAGTNTGDINIGHDAYSNTFGYMIGEQHVLWHNGIPSNIYVGVGAGNPLDFGSLQNTFCGWNAGSNNFYSAFNAGRFNTFIGSYAGNLNINGYENVFVGQASGKINSSGYNNSFIGQYSGVNNQTGYHNTFIGSEAGYGNQDGFSNSIVGYDAGGYSADGDVTLNRRVNLPNLTSGVTNGCQYWNTIMGYKAGESTEGICNGGTAVINGSSIGNSYYGKRAANHMIAGWANTCIGSHSSEFSLYTNENTCIGADAGQNWANGNYFVPWSGMFVSGGIVTSGNPDLASYNVCLGANSGQYMLVGNYNTYLGFNSQIDNSNVNYLTRYYSEAIGAHAQVNNNFQMILGNKDENINVAVGYSGDVGYPPFAQGRARFSVKENYADFATNVPPIPQIPPITNNTWAGHFYNQDAVIGNAIGVEGLADGPSAGPLSTNIGVWGEAENSIYDNAGVVGWTTSNVALAYNVGLFGYCGGAGAFANYGLWAVGPPHLSGCLSGGACTQAAGFFQGDVGTTGDYYNFCSDTTLKNNIAPVEKGKGMSIINQLNVISYTFKTDKPWLNLPQGQKTGLIAQQVDSLLPGLVKNFNVMQPIDSLHPFDSTKVVKMKIINIDGIIPFLIQGMKEQQHQIDSLHSVDSLQKNAIQNAFDSLGTIIMQMQNQLASCCTANSGGGGRRVDTTGNNNQSKSDGSGTVTLTISDELNTAILGQNIPNPANGSTIIPFRIPQNCNSAAIMITEVETGKMVNTIPVNCKETNLSIEAGSIATGTYSYSLYIDGKLVDTKKMVLTK